jgi:hypothetical protein
LYSITIKCGDYNDYDAINYFVQGSDFVLWAYVTLNWQLHNYINTAPYRRYGKRWLQDIMENVGLYSFRIQYESNGYDDM